MRRHDVGTLKVLPKIHATRNLRRRAFRQAKLKVGSEKPHIRPRVAKKPSSIGWVGAVGERAVRLRVSATFSLRLFHQTSIFDSPRRAQCAERKRGSSSRSNACSVFAPNLSSLGDACQCHAASFARYADRPTLSFFRKLYPSSVLLSVCLCPKGLIPL